jgi:hypothetical protein
VGRSQSRGHRTGVAEVGETGDKGAVQVLVVGPPREAV